MSADLERLSAAVIKAREAKGWSKRELALHAGLSESTVYMVESGHREITQTAHRWVERALGWEPYAVAAILEDDSVGVETLGAPPEGFEAAEGALRTK